MLSHVGWPVLVGLAVTSLLYVLIYRGPLNLPIMHRYFASHPVTFCETGLFFIGLAGLVLKCMAVVREQSRVGAIGLPEVQEPEAIESASRLLDEVESWNSGRRESLLGRRLRDALEHIERTGSAAGLGDELKYLADMESARQQDSYSLVRIVVWATPMLGFLGTVMGITEALGDLSTNAGALASSPETAIQGLLGGLYVAFDTTALALTLSMILMFIQFLIDRVEVHLLSVVDGRANEDLVGRFAVENTSSDPQVAVIERMAQSVVRATEQLVQRQSQLWQTTMESAHSQWNKLLTATGDHLQTALSTGLEQSLASHARQLIDAERGVAGQIRQEWDTIQDGLARHATLLQSQQVELSRHGETMVQVLQATGEVIKLEQALNANLAALSGSKNFEETVMSLSAAIHLLNARLGRTDSVPSVDLRILPKSRAA